MPFCRRILSAAARVVVSFGEVIVSLSTVDTDYDAKTSVIYLFIYLFITFYWAGFLQLPRGKGHKRTSRSYSKVPHLTHPPIRIRKTATAPGSPYPVISNVFPPRVAPFNCAIFVAVSAVKRVEANDSAIIVAFRKRLIVVNKAFSRLKIKERCG